jgi:diketogulonate reductase-like aldo/keto reductase
MASEIISFTDPTPETRIPTIEIAEGVHMPMLNLGTWLYDDAKAYDAVTEAFKLGYPGVDTAWDYTNGKGIGEALKQSGRERHEYWITTKIEGGLSYNETVAEFDAQLKDLGVEYVDLLLMHFPTHSNGTAFSPEGRAEQWKAMEKFVADEKTRSIGVSHFCKHHMISLLETAIIPPALNQVEYHIGMGSAGNNATDDKAFHESIGVTYQPFSQLCGPCCMGQPANCTADMELITGEMVTSIGKNYGKSGAQVSLRWLTQQGLPVIPKTNNPKHLAQNMDIFEWNMTMADMATLSASESPAVCGAGDGINSGDCSAP